VRSIQIALLALVLAGCGAHGAAAPRPRARRPAGHPAAAYRWLIRTTGAQPSIAAESRQKGTTAWELPGPNAASGGTRHGPVSGYVAEQTVIPGELQSIYVNAPGTRHVWIRIYRIGWYGGRGGREVLASSRLRATPQPRCTHSFDTGLTECHWRPTLSFRIPSALPSGVYIAKLSTVSGASDCLFVVRASRPQKLLAQLPTATYEAYNAWGGDSLYPGGAYRVRVTGTTQGVEVSYDRPYDSITGAGQFFARDVAMVRFLERYRYPVSYTTDASVDGDPGQLSGYRAVLDFGHSEYWSERQRAAFTRARDHGTSLLFFSSDTLAWRVRYARASKASSEHGAADHTIVAYKEYVGRDPDRAQPTGRFPDAGAGLTGSAYVGCIAPRFARAGPPVYRYYPWSAAAGLQPGWLFAGTHITPTTRIPGIVGYELDMETVDSPRHTRLIGGGAAPCMVASEAGDPIPRFGQNLAQTTLYVAASGALVFSTGTLGWELGLEPVPTASPEAPGTSERSLVVLTRNLLAHVLGGR